MGYLSCRTEAATCTSETAHLKPLRQGEQRSQTSRVFSFSELKAATKNFSEDLLLGKGSHGQVYKGILIDGKQVAVKRVTSASSFDTELEILSKIRSDKVANLLGYARGDDGKYLVVEFMSNGTLYGNLHGSWPPNWIRRVNLALQTAQGILALHSASPPIFHRDIKSSNVLIDENSNAKLGDFGLALRGNLPDLLKTATPPAGTLGYLDPEYETPSNLSFKTDVYSFGILLLELISGRQVMYLVHEPPHIRDWALPLITQGRIDEILDKKMSAPGNVKPLQQILNLAVKCVELSSTRRPSIIDVVEDLKDIYKKISRSRFVRKTVNAQLPGASARRATRVFSHPNQERWLPQAHKLAEGVAKVVNPDQEIIPAETRDDGQPTPPLAGPSQSCADDRGRANLVISVLSNLVADGNIQDTPRYSSRISSPYFVEGSGVESETGSEDFKSAYASFRSSSASASIDLDGEMCDSVRPKSRVSTSKKPSTPISPCLSLGRVIHEPGLALPCEPCNNIGTEGILEDFAIDEVASVPLRVISQVQDLITSQYDLVEHRASRSSSRTGSGSVRSKQIKVLELQTAHRKVMNEQFRTRSLSGASQLSRYVRRSTGGARELEVFSLPNEDTEAAAFRRRPSVAMKKIGTTCLGAVRPCGPCVRLEEEDEQPRAYMVGN